MYKANWGQKRICPCNKIRYYDLGREKLECPECGKEIEVLNLTKPRRGRKPGVSKMKISVVESSKAKPKVIPEEDSDIENADSTNIQEVFSFWVIPLVRHDNLLINRVE